ncbi:MAG TPA: hypothetical protein P5137_04370 [Candidatus Brocadiia bacterium]|nr:hypothetical protein [Candidatus Brocadiia bacterium]
MNSQAPLSPDQISRIRSVPTRRRLPRLGKIRLGIRRQTKDGKEYPSASEFFIFDEELLQSLPRIAEVYSDPATGELAPRELRILLPSDDLDVVFPLRLKRYGWTSGCLCRSTDATATRALRAICSQCGAEECGHKDAPRSQQEVDCPCAHAMPDAKGRVNCAWVGSLMVMLPDVTVGGLFQLDTRSANSITDIQSGLELVRQMVGRLRMIPLRLSLKPRQARPGGVVKTIYTLQVAFDGTAEDLMAMRQLSAPAATPSALIEPPHDDGDDLPPVMDADEPQTALPDGPSDSARPGQAAASPGGLPAPNTQQASVSPRVAGQPGAGCSGAGHSPAASAAAPGRPDAPAQAAASGSPKAPQASLAADVRAALLASAEAAGVENKDRFSKISRLLHNSFGVTRLESLDDEQLQRLQRKAMMSRINWTALLLIPERGE